jgi:FdhD protein
MVEVRCQPLSLDAESESTGERTWVVQEDVLTIEIEKVGVYSLMWTPTGNGVEAVGYTSEDGVLSNDGGEVPDILALAAGFIFSEGMIGGLADIDSMSVCQERPDVVSVRLAHPEPLIVSRRNVVINSSCGVCGGREQLDVALSGEVSEPLGDTVRMFVADLADIRSALQHSQAVFRHTGGTHGAAMFDSNLNVVAIAEDLGRHNALDKVIGRRLLTGKEMSSGYGVFISSRISYEMVAKAVRARLEIVAAVSAPSSMAIQLADRHGITLCGFVRDRRATIYTHPHRIDARRLAEASLLPAQGI